MRKLPSGEQPEDKAMKHQKGNFFYSCETMEEIQEINLLLQKVKPFLVEGIQICVQINNFCLKCFDFTLPRTLRNGVLKETTRILQNLRTSLIALLPNALTCHQHLPSITE